jgi:hypothetical protein
MISWTAMASECIEIVLAKRFRIDRPPTILAHRSSAAQIGFSRIRSAEPARGRSLTVPCEAAFSFHVPMSVPFFSALWTAGKRRSLPAATLGDAFLFDLTDNPVVGHDTPFDSLRFYVTEQALNELAQDRGIVLSTACTRAISADQTLFCSAWRKRSRAPWHNRGTLQRCLQIASRWPSSHTLRLLMATRQPLAKARAAVLRRGSFSERRDSTTPIWTKIRALPIWPSSAAFRSLISDASLSRQRACRRING